MRSSIPLRVPVRRALAIASCVVALLTGGSLGAARGAAPSAPGRDYFGMNAQWVFKLPAAGWDTQLAAIARTGVGEVRRDAFWSEVELSAPVHGHHVYTWTRQDAVVAALARHGLRWYPILDYATSWAGTGPAGWKSAPASPADFAAYATAFARRYGTGGTFWSANPSLPALPVQSYEVWNEPNLDDFWPDVIGAADRYADLLAATAPALRAADPAGRVVLGGLSPTGLTPFLDRVEARRPGLVATVDAVGFHPYGTTWANTGARIRVLRDWLDAHGAAAVPIEVTETGWATPPLPEDTRAARMGVLVPGLVDSSCDVTRFIAHTWVTPDVDPNDPNDYFGVANADATLKPTGVALVDAIAAVEHGTAPTPSDPCAGRDRSADPPAAPAPPDAAAPPPDAPPPATAPPASAPAAARLALPPALGDAAQSNGTPAPVRSARARSHVSVAVHRRHGRVVVDVRCPRACRAVVRLRRARGRPLGTSASARFARRHRTTLRLPAHRAGALIVRVRVHVRGTRPVTFERRLP